MTRIIAGTLGGRRITVPTRGTRPTTDRVREAIFSRLDSADDLRAATVLDAYAGSGALGIEAVSRGAARVTLVESAESACAAIRSNLKSLHIADRASVRRDRVAGFLAATDETYSLALLDPPYEITREELASALAALGPRLAPDAAVVVEWATRAGEPVWPSEIVPERSKRYGDTTVHYARRPAAEVE